MTQAYDKMGNLKKILYPDGRKVQMGYNAVGQLIELEDWLGTTRIERNITGNPEQITDQQGNVMHYEWDCFGKRTKTVYPDGKEIFYQYHEKYQKLSSIRWEDQFIKYEYDENGYLTQKSYSNGKNSSYGYNSNGQLKYLLHSCERGLLKYSYEYDRDGLPTQIDYDTSEGRTTYRYKYDALGRIAEVFEGLPCVRKYEYDPFGNRTLKREEKRDSRYYYNKNNQLMQEESDEWSRRYEYDLRGNIHAFYENGELQESYSYNGNNLLERVIQDGTEIFYQYDGYGHRVKKQVRDLNSKYEDWNHAAVSGIKDFDFIIDFTRKDHNIIHEDSEGNRQSYVWEPQSHHIVGLIKNEKSYFYQDDNLGSPVRLLDQSGAAVASYSYDEFGNRNVCTFGLAVNQDFGFAGYYRDEETSFYHTERRYYNSHMGLFFGNDLIKGNTAEPLTLHPYLFCWNNPLIYTDLDGAYPGAYTDSEGVEADLYLKAYFWWYYTALTASSSTPYPNAKIPGGSLIPGAEDGYCDLMLLSNGEAEITEIKPDSHKNPITHMMDKVQLNQYINAYEKYTNYRVPTYPGTSFNPDGLLIPSLINPDYYIEYQTYYGEGYTYYTGRGNQSPIIDNYDGFIYWGYVRKDKFTEKERRSLWIWIPDENGKGGNHLNDSNPQAKITKFPKPDQDDVAAAVVAGGSAAKIYFIIKLLIGGTTQQWWILVC